MSLQERVLLYLESIRCLATEEQLSVFQSECLIDSERFVIDMPIYKEVTFVGKPTSPSIGVIVEYAIEADMWNIVSFLLQQKNSWTKIERRAFIKKAALKNAQQCLDQLIALWGKDLTAREWSELTKSVTLHWPEQIDHSM